MAIKARLAALGISGVLALAGGLTYQHEGEVLKTYSDPVGILTACVGHTGQDVRLGKYYTEKECTELFVQDLRKAQAAVKRCIKRELPPKMEAASISFAFNVGAGNLCSSTYAKLANAGKLVQACQQLPKWVYAKGVILPGLVKRRAEEMQLCLEGAYES